MDITKWYNWAGSGKRAVRIDVENQLGDSPTIRVWAYDYDIMDGIFCDISSPPPSPDSLKQIAISRLQNRIAEMEGTD